MKPVDEKELGEAIAGADGPLRIVGGGTRGVVCAGDVLSTAGMTGIMLYDPGALTLVARAGTPLVEIEAVLAAEGQRLPFETMDHRGLLGSGGVSTIGGVVAANISGPRRVQAGACRDSLIGVRFVDGRGEVLKSGGRVMKNVTGYDLVKLLAGSYGTLGVLSEVSFKVLPDVETAACIVLRGLGDGQAVAAMVRALGSPYEVSGAAHEGGRTLLRIEGFADSVAYRADRLRELLGEFGEVEVLDDPVQVAAMWRDVRDVAPFQGREGDVWRISVKPSDAPNMVAGLVAEAVVYDWGGGLVWALMEEGTDLRARMGEVRGHATLVRGNGFARFHPEPSGLARISAGIRAQFDPRGILNVGVMG
ncbi:FAD-binding protein [Profundibacter sp.]|uniref:FAD-binding protein n=1 Tax=Profundibacter sp. TaxID=3101071 RepID=UPI003D122AFE